MNEPAVTAREHNHYLRRELECQMSRHTEVAVGAAYRVAERVAELREGSKDCEQALTLALEDLRSEISTIKALVKAERDAVNPPKVRHRFFRWFARTFMGIYDV